MFLGNSILSKLSSSIIAIVLLFGCGPQPSQNPLPIYGEKDISSVGLEVDHTIPEFSFQNQNGKEITLKDYKGKVFIADFFFTTCPTICPIMTDQLARVQKELKGEDYKILSHTVNPEFDTENVLLDYANNKSADLSNWDFVTGKKYKIYRQAAEYLIVAAQDTTQEIEFVHSEKLVLIDKKGRVRGSYDGTNTEAVDQLIIDTKWLIKQ